MLHDFDQLWGNDLTVDGAGKPATVAGTTAGEQRVYRRLMTNPGDYLWHPTYGAGLPRYIGQNLNVSEIEGLCRQQLTLEPAVAPQPVPVVEITPILNGVYVSLQWVDSVTGANSQLGFDLN